MRLAGPIAAAVTPLRDDGANLDPDAVGPMVDYLVGERMAGVLAMGTTGEGMLLSTSERRRGAEVFVEAAAGRIPVAVHCGAQSTAATTELASHAAEAGASAVAVIAPPYFTLDPVAILQHLKEAALACSPVPFYVYEFATRSGYAVPVDVILRLRDTVPNLAGLKVSDTPFDKVEPYLNIGLDVLVGSERMIVPALRAGAVGAVSGLAASHPAVVSDLVRNPDVEEGERVGSLRERIEAFPFHAAQKLVLGWHGVPIRPDVRAPLRRLTPGETEELRAVLVDDQRSG